MNRFFVDFDGREFDKSIDITGEDVNHIKNVLRLKVNDEIIISDGRVEITAARFQLWIMKKWLQIFWMYVIILQNLKQGLRCFRDFQRRIKWNGSSRRR